MTMANGAVIQKVGGLQYTATPQGKADAARHFGIADPRTVAKMYDFTHPESGISYKTGQVHFGHEGPPHKPDLTRPKIGVGGTIHQNGEPVGSFWRDIRVGDHGGPEAHHESQQMMSHVQDQGAGSAWLQHMIPQYQQMGIDRISLHANVDVGPYAWALHGFEPSDPDEKSQMLSRWQGHVTGLAKRGKISPEHHKVAMGLQSVGDIARFDTGHRIPYNTMGKTNQLGHIGKSFLLNTYGVDGPENGWHGAMSLKPEDPSFQRGEAYRAQKAKIPHQPKIPDALTRSMKDSADGRICPLCRGPHKGEGKIGVSDQGSHWETLFDDPSLLR